MTRLSLCLVGRSIACQTPSCARRTTFDVVSDFLAANLVYDEIFLVYDESFFFASFVPLKHFFAYYFRNLVKRP